MFTVLGQKEILWFSNQCGDLKSDDKSIPQLKQTHSLLKEFNESLRKKIKERSDFQDLKQAYQFFVHHATRKAYQLEFIRCQNDDWRHCRALPNRKNNLIRDFNGLCPNPQWSETYKGHYKTFLEMERTKVKSKNNKFFNPTGFGNCKNPNCRYLFFSKADKYRHIKLMKNV